MSLPVTTTISGMESMEALTQNLAIAKGFSLLSEQEMALLRNRCRPAAADGHLELSKPPPNMMVMLAASSMVIPPSMNCPPDCRVTDFWDC